MQGRKDGPNGNSVKTEKCSTSQNKEQAEELY